MDSPQFGVHADIEETHWWFLGRRAIVRALIESVLPPGKGFRLLDIGCGTGGTTASLNGDYICKGVDPNAEGIAMARRRFPAVDFAVGFAPDAVRREMAEADCVLCTDVLEMIDDDFAFVSGFLAAMKPGAYLLLTAAADPSLWSVHDRAFAHCRRYTVERLRQTWEGLPVEEVVCSYINARLRPVAQVARWLGRRRHKAWGPADTDLATPPWPLNGLFRAIFAGERHRLLRGKTYRNGVTVVALLRRGNGDIPVRTKPMGIKPDARPWYDAPVAR